MTLDDQILAFLSEHPSSTAVIIADSVGGSRSSVSTYLIKMLAAGALTRSVKKPYTYSVLDPSAVVEFAPGIVRAPQQNGTRLADEQAVLTALAEGQVNDREALLDLLKWAPSRLAQTLDRLHSAGLIRTIRGSYVLISRTP